MTLGYILLVVYLMVFAAFAGHELLDRKESNYIIAPPWWHEVLAAALWPIILPTGMVYRAWRKWNRNRHRDPCEECGKKSCGGWCVAE